VPVKTLKSVTDIKYPYPALPYSERFAQAQSARAIAASLDTKTPVDVTTPAAAALDTDSSAPRSSTVLSKYKYNRFVRFNIDTFFGELAVMDLNMRMMGLNVCRID
jgi:hypothetical protein